MANEKEIIADVDFSEIKGEIFQEAEQTNNYKVTSIHETRNKVKK